MIDENKEKFRLEVTHDKLIDILMHAATREDIGKLDNKIEKLDGRIGALEGRMATVEEKIEKLDNKIEKLDNKIEKLDDKIEKLDDKIEKLSDKMGGFATHENLLKLERKYDRMLWFIIAGILTPIVLHFIK
jgi:chromosome segregation ATPase